MPEEVANKPSTVTVKFILNNGEEVTCEALEGESVLTVAHNNDVDLEGACEGSLACSTCHVIVDSKWFKKLEAASDEEEDMLDLAFGLTETSRLGCQILLTKELDGLTVQLPSATRNIKLEGKSEK